MDPIDNADLFGFEETFPFSVEDEFGPSLFFILRNLPLNGAVLRQAHIDILRERAVPFLQRSVAFVEIYGMTDRSGSRQLNYKVSLERMRSVQRMMQQLGAPLTKVQHRFAKAIGEDFFEFRHTTPGDRFFVDGQKKAAFRSVIVALTPAPIGVPTKLFRRQTAAEVMRFCRLHLQKAGK